MFEAMPGVATRPDPNSNAAFASQNFFALMPHPMTADYPQAQDAYDWYVADLNSMWWNKIMSGAYLSSPDSGVQPPINYSFDGSPRLLQYVIHTIRDYAVTAQYIFAYFQQSCEVWNNSFSQQDYVGVLDQIRSVFIDARRSSNGAVIVSDVGHALGVLHCRVNGCRPATDMFGHCLWEYINAPRVGFQAVRSRTGVALSGVTPCVLPDITVQTESRLHILALSPMLSTNKMLTGVAVDDGQVTALGGGSYTVPLTIETQARSVGLETIPLLDDRCLFNARLVWHAFPSNLYTLDGTVFSTGVVGSGNIVAQKSIVADWTVPHLLPPSILTANTVWMPFMTPDGRRLAVGVTQIAGAALMTQIMGQKTTTGVATWLIRNAHAMPNTIVDGGGRNKISRIPRRQDAGNASPSSVPVSDAGEAPPSS
jgi:hypothetical protein